MCGERCLEETPSLVDAEHGNQIRGTGAADIADPNEPETRLAALKGALKLAIPAV